MTRTAEKNNSIRTCLACGAERRREDLVRFVVAAGGITPDWRGVLPGRAVYACPTPACLDRFCRLRRFPDRFFSGAPVFAVPRENMMAWVQERAEESLLHFLRLARKSGALMPGQNAARAVTAPAAVLISRDTAERTASLVMRGLPDGTVIIRWGTKQRLGAALGLRPLGVAAIAASPLASRIVHYASIANLFGQES